MSQAPKSQIKYFREREKLTQKELAGLLGTSANTVCSWENKDYKAYLLSLFSRLCDALDCDHTVFLIEPSVSVIEPSQDINTLRKKRRSLESRYDSSPMRRLRENKGLSQEKLAEIVGVTTNTIQSWENNKTAKIRHIRIARLCEILHCSHREIFEYIDIGETPYKSRDDTRFSYKERKSD